MVAQFIRQSVGSKLRVVGLLSVDFGVEIGYECQPLFRDSVAGLWQTAIVILNNKPNPAAAPAPCLSQQRNGYCCAQSTGLLPLLLSPGARHDESVASCHGRGRYRNPGVHWTMRQVRNTYSDCRADDCTGDDVCGVVLVSGHT
jgi:hypothetical protein